MHFITGPRLRVHAEIDLGRLEKVYVLFLMMFDTKMMGNESLNN